jgi:glycosyltransferase involved in cell wall biosynthesis
MHGVEIEIGLPRSRRTNERPGWRVTLLRPSRGLRWYVAPFAFVPYTVRVLREKGVDLLRGHSIRFTGPSLFVSRRIARVRRPIVLHHLHSDPAWRLVEAPILRRADAVITISEHSRHQLLAVGVAPERIHVVQPGVAVPVDVEPAADTWPTDSGVRLLYLGRLERRKRPHVAVATVARLRSRGVHAELVVAGGGRVKPWLRLQSRLLGIDQHIHWRGVVSDREKWALIAAADILLFPSTLEGFGLVVAEAHALGIPVVTAEGTATSEIVIDGETGFIAPSEPDAFADAVQRLSDAAIRARFAAQARERAGLFDWDACAARVAQIYFDICRRRDAPEVARQ